MVICRQNVDRDSDRPSILGGDQLAIPATAIIPNTSNGQNFRKQGVASQPSSMYSVFNKTSKCQVWLWVQTVETRTWQTWVCKDFFTHHSASHQKHHSNQVSHHISGTPVCTSHRHTATRYLSILQDLGLCSILGKEGIHSEQGVAAQ